MLRSVRSAPDAAAAPPAAVTLASWPERAVLLDEPLDALAQGRWRSGCGGGAVPEHRLSTADHLSGLKHGVTKATRTHEGWSAAGSATVSPATAGRRGDAPHPAGTVHPGREGPPTPLLLQPVRLLAATATTGRGRPGAVQVGDAGRHARLTPPPPPSPPELSS